MDPTSPSAAPLPVSGDVIAGKFVLERLLGRGGMGAVFAARHLQLDQRVAIKVMLADPANEEARQRFLNEGRAAARIQSDHVVRVHDLGNELGFEYMILELLEGEDLSQRLERGVLSPQEAVGFGIQALRGLVEAHRHGIVHRDLKPSNLFLARRSDGSSVLKILDFGISKSQSVQSALGQSPGQLTSTKAMLGSPLYMSPEQLRSSKSVDARADIWAFGVILYELMTGRLPFLGESLGELFATILENDPVPPRTYAPAIPFALEQIVLRCLQKRPEHRFASATELLDALASVASGAPSASAMAASALAPAGYAPPPAAARMTPSGPYPAVPGMAATTGSGANMPVVKPLGPHGAMTPQPGQSASWTPATTPVAAGSRAPLVIGGIAAVLVLSGVGLGGAALLRKTSHVAPGVPADVTSMGSASSGASSVPAAAAPGVPSATPVIASASTSPETPAPVAPAVVVAPAASSTIAKAPSAPRPPAAGSRPPTAAAHTATTPTAAPPAGTPPPAPATAKPPVGGGTVVLTR